MKFSIITATLNSESTVKDCLDSVKGQSWSSIEHIIIDGASRDKTVKIVEKYATECTAKNRTVKIYSEPDTGLYDALNKGISKASGDIIGFVHSDDMLADKFTLEEIHNAFIKSGADGIYGDLVYIKRANSNKVIRNWKSEAFQIGKLKYGWMPAHPSLYLRKTIYDDYGVFNLNYKISADYDFILRVFSSETFRFRYIPQLVIKMRIGGESNNGIRSIRNKSMEDYRILKNNKISKPLWALTCKIMRKLPQFILK